MWWLRTFKEALRPEEYFERTLEWHKTAYERMRSETSESMLHTVLAKVFLLWEKENPGADLVTGSKDLAWAYGVTRYFACLPPKEAVEAMALFMAIEKHPSFVKRVPELMARYSNLMGILGGGVENNSLVEMYRRQNLEPSDEQKQFYDLSVQKLFVRTVYVDGVEGQQQR
jgi:hypothetical protein